MSTDYTPTTAEIREQVLWQFDGQSEASAGEAFDRWLARVKAGVQADMRAEFVATADVLYFNGGYKAIRRGMVERVARESTVTAEPDGFGSTPEGDASDTPSDPDVH